LAQREHHRIKRNVEAFEAAAFDEKRPLQRYVHAENIHMLFMF
jgi:hypothetical protein